MHATQRKLLELAREENLAAVPLRRIGARVGLGDDNPRLVQHHLDQLTKKGFLWIDRRAGEMKLLGQRAGTGDLLRIPILGAANCGPATIYADDAVAEAYLSISENLLGLKKSKADRYFAIRAVGDSMNAAKIPAFGGVKTGIDDGDIVIVETSQPDVSKKPYVLAVIDGLANIKKLVAGQGVAKLISESTRKYDPIYIDPSLQDEFVNGQIVGVVKV
jgi:SOS-response transcriptional repressor LexA